MPPIADYICHTCGYLETLHVAELPTQAQATHKTPKGRRCRTTALERVWSAPGIGRVDGAGGSPGRPGK